VLKAHSYAHTHTRSQACVCVFASVRGVWKSGQLSDQLWTRRTPGEVGAVIEAGDEALAFPLPFYNMHLYDLDLLQGICIV